MELVDAQQARRVLARLVGYNLSPMLWKKVKKGLSAGRVQSVALHMIINRENEIRAFKHEEYWTVEGSFIKDRKPIKANASKFKRKKHDLKNEEEVKEHIEKIKTQDITKK